ncbi:hypothetical protein TRIUR3_17238 [Triticum urartu]|uniref:Uncharacterized protein n=1 Tax=Triticum urartu TaxID=4572 RepID=M8A840_TRIUA|nr:hypothetical protein TRIUR3_17238 [Triticum urartu]
MTKSMMPLLEGTSDGGNRSGRTGDGGGSRRNMKPVQLPKTLRITAARANPNQSIELACFSSSPALLYIGPFSLNTCDPLEYFAVVTLFITLFRDKRIRVKNLDLMSGPIVVNLEEKLFTKKPSTSTVADQKDESTVDNKSAAKPEGSKLLSLNKKIDLIPEKLFVLPFEIVTCYIFFNVSFNMSKLDLKFLPKDHGLSINNEFGSISVRLMKSQPQNDLGVAPTHLWLETDVTDIHLLMDGSTSVLEVVKIATVVSANIPTQVGENNSV